MTETDLQQYKSTIRSFEQRVINRSISQLLLFDRVADLLLDCCANTKPATLSFLSYVPLAVVSIFIRGGESLWFGLAALAIFLHQVLDVANKKQAYRLYQFSLGTFYIDHLYDSISVGLLVYIITRMMQFSLQNVWISIFCFGLLPFYVSHLRMYYTGYLEFQLFSPSAEGLLIFVILFIVSTFVPNLFQIQLSSNFIVYHAITGIAILWLVFFLAKQIWDIKTGNKNADQIAIRNLFIILALGYIFFETSIIMPHLLDETIYFVSILMLNITHFSVIIGRLVMNYGTATRFNQISLNTLLVNSVVIGLYSLLFFVPFAQIQILIAEIAIGALAIMQTLYFLYFQRTSLAQINQAINQ